SALVIIFLYQPVKVEGTSMWPGLDDQERIFINKFVYRLEPIERGDIVVFRYPRDTSKSYIKRVIGVAGDHVSIVNGAVILNGRELKEPYVPLAYSDTRSLREIVVPDDTFLVPGAHRGVSDDSREFVFVIRRFVCCQAVFFVSPVGRPGRS